MRCVVYCGSDVHWLQNVGGIKRLLLNNHKCLGRLVPWLAASLGEGQLRFETHECQVCWTASKCKNPGFMNMSEYPETVPQPWVNCLVPSRRVPEPEARRRILRQKTYGFVVPTDVLARWATVEGPWAWRGDLHHKRFAQAGRKSLTAPEKRRKRQVLDGTGSLSLSSTCRRLRCIGGLSDDLRQQQHSAALWATKQPSLGRALLAPHGDGPRKGSLNKACLILTWLASRSQRASLLSGKKNNERKKTVKSLLEHSHYAGLCKCLWDEISLFFFFF